MVEVRWPAPPWEIPGDLGAVLVGKQYGKELHLESMVYY